MNKRIPVPKHLKGSKLFYFLRENKNTSLSRINELSGPEIQEVLFERKSIKGIKKWISHEYSIVSFGNTLVIECQKHPISYWIKNKEKILKGRLCYESCCYKSSISKGIALDKLLKKLTKKTKCS